MSEAQLAREAALPMEAKKDSLRQTQDGLWKVTFTVKAEDMPQAILNAAMGTRYMLAVVQIGDNEEPVRQEDTPGQRAKKHFEASMTDRNFRLWLHDNYEGVMGADSIRDAAKAIMGIQSANELIDNPEPWHRLFNEYTYRNVRQ